MISEVANALFLTYVATEYLVCANDTPSGKNGPVNNKNQPEGLLSRRRITVIVFLAAVVGIINIVDHVTGSAEIINEVLQRFLHLPKALFASITYIIALFVDCKRVSPKLSIREFLPMVGKYFCKVLPLYPFLAVMISFVFMLLINLFETIHLPLEWLNWPIYYGTLYGPFSFVYWKVKEEIIQECYFLYSLPSYY